MPNFVTTNIDGLLYGCRKKCSRSAEIKIMVTTWGSIESSSDIDRECLFAERLQRATI